MTKTLKKRPYTQDVYFRQCSLDQVFFWQGNTYKKLPGNRAERRTDDSGKVLKRSGDEVNFSDEEVVVISNSDYENLRFKS